MPGGPPPSQKGKFKPRKPAKKVRPAGAAAAVVAAASAVAPDEAPSSAGGRGGRGRGRGGRGGRGRGRMPLPQGKVFFTATPKPAGTASTSRKRTKDASADAKKKSAGDPTEEVVGQLDDAIGAKKGGEREHKSVLDSMDYEEQHQDDNATSSSMNINIEGIVYDSDSSAEEERSAKRGDHQAMPPVQLPFPLEELPIGVGEQEKRSNMYECQDDLAALNVSESVVPQTVASIRQQAAQPDPSPFVEVEHEEGLQFEKDTWFMIQMPTRLPTLKPNAPDVPLSEAYSEADEQKKKEAAAAAANVGIPMPAIAEVATDPVDANSFDNSLPSTAPGRLGKIVVHKSGKTVLVLEGPDGNKIEMIVTEGLSCGFLQQAVALNIQEGKYVMLGDVKKSIIVTPDLDQSFPAR